jgi:primosomal protein N'
VIEAAALADPARLSATEEPVRRALSLPPYAALAVLSGPGAVELARALEKLGTGVASAGVDDDGGGNRATRGPFGASSLEVSELGDGRWVVRAPEQAMLADALSAAGRPEERARVEVGPVRF